jgi:8-oxo-dGTP pyrophosphatase MutT (NUDIX family)
MSAPYYISSVAFIYCDCIDPKVKYKAVRKDGIIAAIIYKKKVLLLKRRNLPIILNPGIWAFLSGGKEKGESYLSVAYREVEEEISIKKQSLKLLYHTIVTETEPRLKQKWPNHFYIFLSSTNKITLDIENSDYRWATMRELRNHVNYTNVFIGEDQILDKIGECVNGKLVAKRKN